MTSKNNPEDALKTWAQVALWDERDDGMGLSVLQSVPQEVGVPSRAGLGGSVPARCATAARCTACPRDRDASNCNVPPSSRTVGLCLSRDRLKHTHTHGDIQMSFIATSITKLIGEHCWFCLRENIICIPLARAIDKG